MNKKYFCIAAAVTACGIISVSEACKSNGGVSIGKSDTVQADTPGSFEAAGESDSTAGAVVPVHIDGMVQNPGVYYVDESAIVNDVLKLAGGGTPDADYSRINLAESVYAGMKIVVYSVNAEENTGYGDYEPAKEQPVNINTADRETLMTLPGIGESKAESIMAYRRENGRFKSKEDIMKISGIKTALYNKIKDKITV